MATESFYHTIMIDDNSIDCIQKVLKSTKEITVKCNKNFKILSKEELRVLFSGEENV